MAARVEHDWKKARRLYERDGKSFTEIGEIIGATRDTVASHCKDEGWISYADVTRASSGERIQKLVAGFVEQEAQAIRENLAAKHSLNRRIMALAEKHVERLEQDRLFELETGRYDKETGAPITVTEDPVQSLRRLALVAQSVEAMDKSIADLKGGEWRGGEKKPEAEQGAKPMTLDQVTKQLREKQPPEELVN